MERKTQRAVQTITKAYVLTLLGIIITSLGVALFVLALIILSKMEDGDPKGLFLFLLFLTIVVMGLGVFLGIKGVLLFKERYMEREGYIELRDPKNMKKIENITRGLLCLLAFVVFGVAVIVAILCANEDSYLKLSFITTGLISPVLAVAFLNMVILYLTDYAHTNYFYDVNAEKKLYNIKIEPRIKLRKCPNCNNEIGENEKTCPFCDYEIEE